MLPQGSGSSLAASSRTIVRRCGIAQRVQDGGEVEIGAAGCSKSEFTSARPMIRRSSNFLVR